MSSCPIDGLPPEILAAIFVYINERSYDARLVGDTSYGPIDYPVMFSHVCSRWRHVAISTPLLWSRIDFATAGPRLENLGRVKLYFSRAKTYPIHIRIGTHMSGCVLTDLDESVASLLRPISSRLESLVISYYHHIFTQQVIFALFARREAPPVTRLALHAHSGSKRIIADPEYLFPRDLDQLFSNLEVLYLDSVSPDWDRLPCRNLVELQLIELPLNGYPTVEQIVNLLKENPGLRTIRLSRFFIESMPELTEIQPISLPLLQHLDLDLSFGVIDVIFNLIVPGSRSLSMRLATWLAGGQRTELADSFIRFSKRARITSLHLIKDGISFSHIFRYLPYLRTLRLSRQMLLESTFAGIAESAALLPRLHTFEIETCANGGVQNGLQSMCRIPSLRRIRYKDFALYDDGIKMNSDEVTKWFMSDCGRDDIEVEELPESEFPIYPSPFS